jgi:hypothetical protein
MGFFEAPRPRAGAESVGLRLGPLALAISGLDERRADALARRYAPYATRPAPPGDGLWLELCPEPVEHFLEPVHPQERVRVLIACDGPRIRYLSYRVAGWFEPAGKRGQLLLSGGLEDFEPEPRALENFVRAAVAWRAAASGGALVHAASAVRNDRGYLFYGESGAGKSTLSACNRRGRVVSDDLSLVLPEPGGRLDLVGSPFRGTYDGGPPVVGRFPLAAGFRRVQAETAEVRTVARPRALAELVGNLPFVAEAFAERGDLFEQVTRSFAGIPLGHLRFRKDDSYWDAIEAAGL